MAPSAFIMPAATASPWSIPRATGTPSPRIEPLTFQDTAARVSEAAPLHGCAAGSGSPDGSGSLDGGRPPAPGAGGWLDDPCARPDNCPRRPPAEGVAAGRDQPDIAANLAAPLPDALAPALPVEDTVADPPAPLDAADCDAPCPRARRALVGNTSVLDLTWADAKGPACPPGIMPASMAIAWSCCAGSDP